MQKQYVYVRFKSAQNTPCVNQALFCASQHFNSANLKRWVTFLIEKFQPTSAEIVIVKKEQGNLKLMMMANSIRLSKIEVAYSK